MRIERLLLSSFSMLQSNSISPELFRYGFSYFDEDPNSEVGENKQKDKPKKSRLLYNTTDNVDDTEDDGSIEKGNGNFSEFLPFLQLILTFYFISQSP